MTEETRLDKKSWSGNKVGVIRKYLERKVLFGEWRKREIMKNLDLTVCD